ncbi:uncharacterized protein An12g09080 [Aspergillus niger]|uniref:Contig An12c0310, genomic contig n=2 Tax=Aspergillus niger TaxID=5061 RepID=A2R0M1_ASPNC|nr:uncharacterized protein An12g09080 [Aspergillus niger]CAK46395.1 unnamed protein product [Aspergillus niger]
MSSNPSYRSVIIAWLAVSLILHCCKKMWGHWMLPKTRCLRPGLSSTGLYPEGIMQCSRVSFGLGACCQVSIRTSSSYRTLKKKMSSVCVAISPQQTDISVSRPASDSKLLYSIHPYSVATSVPFPWRFVASTFVRQLARPSYSSPPGETSVCYVSHGPLYGRTVDAYTLRSRSVSCALTFVVLNVSQASAP